ncbi:MAG: hypothetical protein ACREGD_02430 [Candidatus Saccharimonadales bacterium]
MNDKTIPAPEPNFEDLYAAHDSMAGLAARRDDMVARLDTVEEPVRELWTSAISQLSERLSSFDKLEERLGKQAAAEYPSAKAALDQLTELSSIVEGELSEQVNRRIETLEARLGLMAQFIVREESDVAEPEEPQPLSLISPVAPAALVQSDTIEGSLSTSEPAIEGEDTQQPLDKHLNPNTALVTAVFLTLAREELKILGCPAFDTEYAERMLDAYQNAFLGADLQTQRDSALESVIVMLEDQSAVEDVFYALAERDNDPRSDLFLYLTNLPSQAYSALRQVLKEKQQTIIELIQTDRSGPHIESVTQLSRIQPLEVQPEAEDNDVAPDYSFTTSDAALLALFLYKLKHELGQDDTSALEAKLARQFLTNDVNDELDRLNASEFRERLNNTVNRLTNADHILLAVAQLDYKDPRAALLGHMYDLLTNSDSMASAQSLRDSARTMATIILPKGETAAEATQPAADLSVTAPAAEAKKRPAIETLCRHKIGTMLDKLKHLDLTDTHSSGLYIEVLGKRARNAVGSGKEHQELTISGGQVSVADMIFSMLGVDGDRRIVEFVRRQGKVVRSIINSGIQNIEKQKEAATN